jgi:hypothetical protein
MANAMNPQRERRRGTRVSPKGAVILRTREHTLRGRIGNLGNGGMCVMTQVTAPASMRGKNVDVELRLDGGAAAWIDLSGRVLRIASDRIAVGFDTVPPRFDAMIAEQKAASNTRRRKRTIVLVDATVARRTAIAAAFRTAGCDVIEVGSPLEAIVRLGESHFEPDLIAIADSRPESIAVELRAFVDAEHPGAKMITIGDTSVPPELGHQLSSLDLDGDLAARVHEILSRPRITPVPKG